MSSPRLNNLIVVGCIMTYFSVILFGLDGGVVPTVQYGKVCIVSCYVPTVQYEKVCIVSCYICT